jgi:hypothetical protein
MIVPAFADLTKDAVDAKEAIGMRRKVTGAAAVREAAVVILLEVVVFVGLAAAVGARPARLAVGALAFAGLAAMLHLSVTFDDASGVTMPSAVSGPPPPGAEGNRSCAGGLQRPRW